MSSLHFRDRHEHFLRCKQEGVQPPSSLSIVHHDRTSERSHAAWKAALRQLSKSDYATGRWRNRRLGSLMMALVEQPETSRNRQFWL